MNTSIGTVKWPALSMKYGLPKGPTMSHLTYEPQAVLQNCRHKQQHGRSTTTVPTVHNNLFYCPQQPFLMSTTTIPTFPNNLSYCPQQPFLLSTTTFPTVHNNLSYCPQQPFLLSTTTAECTHLLCWKEPPNKHTQQMQQFPIHNLHRSYRSMQT